MECLKVLVLMFVSVYSHSETHVHREFIRPKVKRFHVYWNVPTQKCIKYKVNFEKRLKNFGITVNSEDKFRGDKIAILYDPGLFPVMLKNSSEELQPRNGGIPQKGNLTDHLEAFKKAMEEVPQNFSGLGVIDFEAWRPIFRQNWNDQVVYKEMSIQLVKNSHFTLTDQEIKETATREFEVAAKKFMEETLKLAKTLRPDGKWGYYGFPYCYNNKNKKTAECHKMGVDENNRTQWLFNESTALYPSFYVSSNLTTEEQKKFYLGKLNETSRVVKDVTKELLNMSRVYPYIWFKYRKNDEFLSNDDINQVLEVTKQYPTGGAIIWGSSRNVDTKKKCKELLRYLKTDLGPAVAKVTGKNKQNSNRS